MRPVLYIIPILLCLTYTALGQKRPKSIPIPKRVKGVNENCYYKEKYSATKRLSFYPFNVSDSIVLVSFRSHYKNYPIKSDTVLVDSLIEAKHLSRQEIDQFTDILYNNFYIKPDNIAVIMQCFNPRNAILFYGKDGKLKESIIICFHCSNFETNSKEYGLLGQMCDQKLDKIRNFFIANGVKFGTDMSIDIYPGETDNSEGLASF